jgi:hypothetical protein
MASTEDIEAKLAAYVDGEIDEAGRAEIEQHLATNPQHRKLIAELMQQRQLLKNLPREMAPADIAETINAQLERAVLLGDIDDREEASSLRINFWPRMRLIAAVVVLTAGLGLTIYFLAPWPTNKPPELATIRSLPTVPEIDEARPMRKADEADAPLSARRHGAETSIAAKGGAEAGGTEQQKLAKDALAAGAFVNPAPVVSNVGTAGEQMFRDVVTSQLSLGRPSADNSMVVVICTPNPGAAEVTVTGYLDRNGIAWERSTEPMPSRLNLTQSQVASASRFRQESVQLKSYTPPAGAVDEQKDKLIEATREASQIQTPPAEQGGQAPSQPAQNDTLARAEQADPAAKAMPQQMQQQAAAPQSQQPQDQLLQVPREPSGPADQDQLAGSRGFNRSDATGQLIFARQVPRSQAEEIYRTLGTPNLEAAFELERNWAKKELARQNETVTVATGGNLILGGGAPTSAPATPTAGQFGGRGGFGGGGAITDQRRGGAAAQMEDSAGAAGKAGWNLELGTPTTGPAAPDPQRLIQTGDTLTISIPQLSNAPGLERDNTLQVSEGTIALPLIGPMQAAGLSEQQLAEQIRSKYREGQLLPDATATVTLAPATQPLTAPPLRSRCGVLSPRPSSAPALSYGNPTTPSVCRSRPRRNRLVSTSIWSSF